MIFKKKIWNWKGKQELFYTIHPSPIKYFNLIMSCYYLIK